MCVCGWGWVGVYVCMWVGGCLCVYVGGGGWVGGGSVIVSNCSSPSPVQESLLLQCV